MGAGAPIPSPETNLNDMRHLLWIAAVLFILYIVLRLAAGVVGFALHLLWIAAVIMLAIWLIGKITGRGTPNSPSV